MVEFVITISPVHFAGLQLPQRTKLFRRRIRVPRFDSGWPNLYDSVEHENWVPINKEASFEEKTVRERKLIFGLTEAIADAMSRWFRCSEICTTLFGCVPATRDSEFGRISKWKIARLFSCGWRTQCANDI